MIVKNPKDIFDCIHFADFENLVKVAMNFDRLPVTDILDWHKHGDVILEDLCEQWAKSVMIGKPDFSVYSHPAYLNESFNCWKVYSRRYLQLLEKFVNKDGTVISKDAIHNVLDLGCGCGYTTIGLSAIFPDANIFGTNLHDTLQFKIDQDVTENMPKCFIISEENTLDLKKVDLVFASEFFEHLDRPVELLNGIIDTYRPKFFVFANTFTKMSIGHFNWYYHDGVRYSGHDMSRTFLRHLRARGYEKVNTGFFNSRPQIYMRKDGFKLGG